MIGSLRLTRSAVLARQPPPWRHSGAGSRRSRPQTDKAAAPLRSRPGWVIVQHRPGRRVIIFLYLFFLYSSGGVTQQVQRYSRDGTRVTWPVPYLPGSLRCGSLMVVLCLSFLPRTSCNPSASRPLLPPSNHGGVRSREEELRLTKRTAPETPVVGRGKVRDLHRGVDQERHRPPRP